MILNFDCSSCGKKLKSSHDAKLFQNPAKGSICSREPGNQFWWHLNQTPRFLQHVKILHVSVLVTPVQQHNQNTRLDHALVNL